MNKIDVLLVAAPSPNPSMYFAYSRQGMPPLGLGYLATVLKESEYTVKIIDMGHPKITVNVMIDTLKSNDVRLIGFSCTTETYSSAVRLAAMAKEISDDYSIVFGGPHVSFEYEATLNSGVVDYVVLNEGERVLKNLCDYVIRKTGAIDDVKGIAFMRNNAVYKAEPEPFIENLDVLPIPDRAFFENLSEYALPATVSTSRGCPGKCAFCAASVLSGGRHRMRSVKSIIDEFEYLKSLGFKQISIIDDTMTADADRFNSFLDELISRKLDVTWYCESRIDSISRDLLLKSKAAGCTYIQYGVESANQSTLDNINKDIRLEQIYEVFNLSLEIGIGAATNLIIGLPSDSKSDVENTLSLAGTFMSMGAEVSASICTPYPGTPLWNAPQKFEIEIVDYDLDNYTTLRPVFNSKHLTLREIRNLFYRAIRLIGEKRLERASPNANDDSIFGDV